jgi:predicted AAA+ superfamily ATPase
MGLKQILRPVKGVLENPELDRAVAPSLGKVYQYIVGRYRVESPVDEALMEVYGHPSTFFDGTYLTEGMRDIFNSAISALTRGEGGVIILPSVFGGGKTHTLLALIHGLLNPEEIMRAEPKEEAVRLSRQVIEGIGKLDLKELVVIDGEYGGPLAPSSIEPYDTGQYTIKTIWGLIGHLLGRYDIVKRNDEEGTAPSLGALMRLFEGRRTVILVDEIAEYILRLPEAIRDGVWEQFLRLLKALPQAVQGRKAVFLITVPMRVVGPSVEVERLYAPMAGKLKELYEALRHQYGVISPVRLEDRKSPDGRVLEENEVVRILRKRIFGTATPTIPQSYLLQLRGHYSKVYSEDVFPSDARDIDTLLRYYPFHPTYIDTLLRHVAERDPERYQKTRFALALTRKVTRRLWHSRRDPDFIHTWAVDLEDPDIRNFVDPESTYTVYVARMLDGCNNLSEPELAKLFVKTVFIRTFLYDGLPFSERICPDRSELCWSLYDSGLEAELTRMRVAMEEVIERPDVGYIVEQNNLIFFTRILTIGELVKKTATEIYEREKSTVLEGLREMIRDRLTVADVSHRPLSRDHTVILTEEEVEGGLMPEESNIHRAVIYLGTVDERLATKLVQGYMSYNNTTVLIDVPPDDASQRNLRDLKRFIATMIACDRLGGKLEEMFPEEEIRSVNQAMLKSLKKGATKNLGKIVMDTFKRAWYPEREGTKFAINTEPVKCLLALATAVLIKEQKLLDPARIDLNVLLDELGEVGYDLRKEPKHLSGIVETFLMNPRLYMADKDMISRTLMRFYESLDLAVYRDRVYWKRVYRPGEEPRLSDTPAEALERGMTDRDSIAFWEVYAGAFIDQLLRAEGEEAKPDRVVRRFYILRSQFEHMKLKDLAITSREELPVMLKDPKNTLHLVVEEIETGFYLDVVPSNIEVKPRAPIEVEVDVKPVGEFMAEVILDAEHGVLEPSSGVPPFKARWRLTAGEEEKIYTYMITGTSGILQREGRLVVKVVGEWEILRLPMVDYTPLQGDIIKGFEGLDNPTILRILADKFVWLGGLNLELEAEGSPESGGKIEVLISDVKYDEGEALIQALDKIAKREVKADLRAEEEKPLDDANIKRVAAILKGFLPTHKELIVIKRKRR